MARREKLVARHFRRQVAQELPENSDLQPAAVIENAEDMGNNDACAPEPNFEVENEPISEVNFVVEIEAETGNSSSLKDCITQWSVACNIKQNAVSALLKDLSQSGFPVEKKDARTARSTPTRATYLLNKPHQELMPEAQSSEPQPECHLSQADSSSENDDNAVEQMCEVQFESDFNASSTHTDRDGNITKGRNNCNMLVTMTRKQQKEISALQEAVAKQGVMITRLCRFFFKEDKIPKSFMPFKFPLKEDQELQQLEEYLAASENQEKLKQWIRQTKGTKELKAFLPNLINFNVQSLYNVRGVRGKKKFANFEHICDCLFDCFKKKDYRLQEYMTDLEKALRDGKVKRNKITFKRKQQTRVICTISNENSHEEADATQIEQVFC